MKRYTLPLTCKKLFNMMNRGDINFDCAVQRNKVWDLDKKSLLIHSILYGYSVPAFYLVKNDDDGYDSLDGKQRSNAIYEFMNNELILSEKTPPVMDEEGNTVVLAGMTYDELSDWAKDEINSYSLLAYYYEDMTPEEVKEFFYRLNNGKALTAVELNRVKAKSIYVFQDIATHGAITAVLSDKARKSFTHENMAMQIYAMIHMPEPDFGTKAFRPYIQSVDVQTEEADDIKSALDAVYDLLTYVEERADSEDEEEVKAAKRVMRKIKARTHFVAITYLAYLSRANFDKDAYNKVVFDFFNTATTSASPSYNAAVGAGSAKPDAVRSRKMAMESLFRSKLA